MNYPSKFILHGVVFFPDFEVSSLLVFFLNLYYFRLLDYHNNSSTLFILCVKKDKTLHEKFIQY